MTVPDRRTETQQSKATRYLTEGRVTVRAVGHTGVVAFIEGDSGLRYRVEYSPDQQCWSCNCPHRPLNCAHVIAVQLITHAHPQFKRQYQ